jgi:hypothetical protein
LLPCKNPDSQKNSLVQFQWTFSAQCQYPNTVSLLKAKTSQSAFSIDVECPSSYKGLGHLPQQIEAVKEEEKDRMFLKHEIS